MNKLEDLIRQFSGNLQESLWTKHRRENSNCIAFVKLMQASKEGKSFLSDAENIHLRQCDSCFSKWQKWTLTGYIYRTQLPAAAGSPQTLQDLSAQFLPESNLPLNCTIVCEQRNNGYVLYIESDIPQKMTLVFMKDKERLYEVEISEQIPDEIIPINAIFNWTEIRILQDRRKS